jgi:hypothetical protein
MVIFPLKNHPKKPPAFCCSPAEFFEVLRGAFVLLLDVRAVFNDQSELPVASWLVQAGGGRS